MAELSKTEIVQRALRRAIIEQALAPGAKLPEDVVGAHFNVSRTIVRGALNGLHAEGLVEVGGKRIATVASPSLQEARDVFEVRRSLERDVVKLVAERWTAQKGAELEGHVRLEEGAARGGIPATSIRLAGEFHVLLARLSDNRLLHRYVSEIVSRCSLILALYGRPHSSDCAVTEHREIIAALREGRPDEAISLMAAHLGSVEERALLVTPRSENLDTVLARYSEADAPDVVPLRTRKRSGGGRS